MFFDYVKPNPSSQLSLFGIVDCFSESHGQDEYVLKMLLNYGHILDLDLRTKEAREHLKTRKCRINLKSVHTYKGNTQSEVPNIFIREGHIQWVLCMAFCLQQFYDKNYKFSCREAEAQPVGTAGLVGTSYLGTSFANSTYVPFFQHSLKEYVQVGKEQENIF